MRVTGRGGTLPSTRCASSRMRGSTGRDLPSTHPSCDGDAGSMTTIVRLLGVCAPLLIWSGCNSDDRSPNGASADSGTERDAAGGTKRDGAGTDGGPVPFGDCTAKNWGNTSDACWSCFCKKCATELDVCGPDCFKGVQCANDKHALVGVAGDLPCELRAFAALCLSDPVLQAASGPLLGFDTCLIASHDPATEHLRACEAECGVSYTGDVCARFPAPDGG